MRDERIPMTTILKTETADGIVQVMETRTGCCALVSTRSGRLQGKLPLTWEDARALCDMLNAVLEARLREKGAQR
jgi:hypothetical protein